MSLQYDRIGSSYEGVKALPTAGPEKASVFNAVGDVSGRSALDLACGSGFYTREFDRLGAKRVVGIDISPEMIKAARTLSNVEHGRIEYHVADCTQAARFGAFDLVTGIWLLNYAEDEDAMVKMFSFVRDNLAPDGKFVGITQNPWYTFDGPSSHKYGFTFEYLGEVEHGRKVHVRAATEPLVEFDTFIADAEVYQRNARAAGLMSFQWHPLTIPDTEPSSDHDSSADYWSDFRANPCMALCMAAR